MHWIALQPQPEAGVLAATLTEPLQALGWWALRYTPKVTLLPGAVLLEVSGSTRLWGGQAALLRHIYTSNKPLALVQYARGATSFIAFGRLLAPHKPALAADALPLSALLAAQAHLPTLLRLGCTRWGDLRALPRAGVARRFGQELVDALDQAYGERPDVYPWLTLPEVFEARLELPSQVENASALLFAARRLLAQLQVWLQLRQCGVLALALTWEMDARRHTAQEGTLELRTAEPVAGTEHVQRLLAERLNQLTLPAPVLALRLRTLQTQALAGTSGSLLPDEQPQGDSLAQLLERLSARLGASKVLQLQALADHRPEQMQAWVQAGHTMNSIATSAYSKRARGQKHLKLANDTQPLPTHWASALQPTWLLTPPRQLSVRRGQPVAPGPLTLLAGPQRLEAGWWGSAQAAATPLAQAADAAADVVPHAPAPSPVVLRDYFLARTEAAVLLWIYRERLGGVRQAPSEAWYLHGIFA